MALVVHPEGTQVSGSIGGTTYSRNRYGAYRRNRSMPVNPNTDRQVGVRTILRNLAIYWGQTLTQLQRDAWNVYAANVPWINRLGQVVYLTGEAHFIRSNSARLAAGALEVDDAPVVFDLAMAPETFTPTASEATQQISLAFDNTEPWATEDDGHLILSMGLPRDASIAFFNGPWRLAGKIDGDGTTPPTSPALIAVPWPVAEGQRLWVRARATRADGRLSQFAQANFLCSA